MAAGGALLGAVGTFGSDQDGGMVPAVILVVLTVVLGAVAVVFARLRIEAGDDALRFRFGPFGPTLNAADIQSAEAAPYRWLAFGGWGIRFGRVSGHSVRAYSVPFLRSGVLVEAAGGKRYYVSSRRPEALAAAIRELAAPPGR